MTCSGVRWRKIKFKIDVNFHPRASNMKHVKFTSENIDGENLTVPESSPMPRKRKLKMRIKTIRWICNWRTLRLLSSVYVQMRDGIVRATPLERQDRTCSQTAYIYWLHLDLIMKISIENDTQCTCNRSWFVRSSHPAQRTFRLYAWMNTNLSGRTASMQRKKGVFLNMCESICGRFTVFFPLLLHKMLPEHCCC